MYFLSSIVSCGDLTVEKDVGGFITDESCTITKFCLGERLRRSKRAFLYVEVMWRESSRSEHIHEFIWKSGGIPRIICAVSTG